MPNWSKEDSYIYNKSEVMQELEKRVIDTINRAEILNQKIAQDSALTRMEKFDKATRSATQAVDNLKKTMTAGTNLSDDPELEEGEDGELLDASQDDLIEELRAMANSAIEDGNIKLAYRIERAIDELREDEIKCE
jgi:hypothetical protein